MKKIVLVLSLTTALSGLMLSAQGHAPAVQTVIAPDRLARIDRALQQYVDDNRIAGAVALVLQDGKPVYERAVGWADKEAGRRMTTDTIFRIASQTKTIPRLAILSLLEEGKIGLNDPAGRYIPGLVDTPVRVQTGSQPAAILPATRQI